MSGGRFTQEELDIATEAEAKRFVAIKAAHPSNLRDGSIDTEMELSVVPSHGQVDA